MSYPQGGYQQQPQQPWQPGGQQGGGQQGGGQPGGYGQQGGGYNYPTGSTGSPAAAIIGGILALVTAVALVVAGFGAMNTFTAGGGSFGDLPGEVIVIVIGLFVVGAIMLIGAIMMFVRKVAGAFIVLIGAILAVALILLEPTLLTSAGGGGDTGFGEYLKAMFKFGSDVPDAPGSYVMWVGGQAIGLITAVLALIVSVIPPSLNWLRGSPAATDGGYPQQQQGGYQGW